MLMRDDMASLWRPRDVCCAVMVVEHDHVSEEIIRFLGGPYFPEYAHCEDAVWRHAELDAMLSTSGRGK